MNNVTKTHDFCGNKKANLTVVLIHGIASNSTTFNDLLKYLENLKSLQNVRFVTFDLLGSGKSLKDDNLLNYDYKDQLTALRNSIKHLELESPLVLVGHSLGTFIVTKYASSYKNAIKKLILISPPVFTVEDLENPAFMMAIKTFKDLISIKNRNILKEKSFNNSMEKIVLDKKNYQTLAEIEVPTELIYGEEDKLIASYNIPKLLKKSKNIVATKTSGKHGVTRDKYARMAKILEETTNVENL